MARPALDRLGRAGPRRAGQAAAGAGPAGRPRAAGRHRPGRRTCCPSCRRCALEIDEHHRHKDVYEHSLTVLEQAIALEDRRRTARCPGPTSCCAWPRCCTTSASRRPAGSRTAAGCRFHHHEVVGAKLGGQAAQGAALRQGHRQGGRPAGRAAPALPRLRRRRVDRLGRAPLRHRRRTAAAAAAPADPLGLHHPQPAQGRRGCRAAYDDLEARIARLRRAGGAGRGPARPGRQPDRRGARHLSRSGARPGLQVPAVACGWTTGRSAPRPRREALREWWATQPESAAT